MAFIIKRQWRTAKGEERSSFAVDFTDAHGKRQRKQHPTWREANAFRIKIESQLKAGTFRHDATKITVREAAALFLAHCEERMQRRERMTRRNFQTYQGYVKNYIAPDPAWHATKHAKARQRFRYFDKGIGTMKLAELTVGTITRFRDDLRKWGVSVPTTRKIITMLRVMLNYLIGFDLLVINVAKDVEVIGRRDEGAKKIMPPAKEVVRELIALAKPDVAVVLMFAASTGVRAGELHALRWHHINVAKREVTIETRVDPYGDEDVPKTKAGMRSIPLGEEVLAALRAWKLRSDFTTPADLVFPNGFGRYQNHDDMMRDKFDPLFVRLARKWKEERRNEPLERFTWHALRHFAISCWIDAGLPPKTVQTFAGHSSLQVTMDRYGHMFRSEGHGHVMDAIAKEIYGGQEPSRATVRRRPAKARLSEEFNP